MLILLYVFVSHFDLLGAGFAALLCVLFIYPGMIIYIRKKTGLSMRHYFVSLIITILLVAAMAYCLSLIDISSSNPASWVGMAILTGLVYVLILLLLGLFVKIGPGFLFLCIK